ncbi:TetR/AcrR family transcriptional regulator C-terminal domain-containing protein [Streptomyces vastus]|uniref:TetR/AcrR family transcriptional regulator C-terminal domain-containing protein n=2 Tax=Streptomyces vastus TaxID=285451 RepID=A0ABN3QC55_9ACTN
MSLRRDGILDAALGLVDKHGLESLSMRKLATVLGVEAMSLYNHVPNKAALLDGLLERCMDEVETGEGDGLSWSERLRCSAWSVRRVALRHPSFLPLLNSQEFHSEKVLRPVESALAALREAGFDEDQAIHAYQTLIGFVLGFSLQEGSGVIGLTCCNQSMRELGCELSEVGLVPERFPFLISSLSSPAIATSDASFDFGLELILSGLQGMLRKSGE